MQILRLEAENFKRLRAIQIDPKGDLVLVAGRNAQGKSSVLDAIAAALMGKDACPADPIRHGEQSATIRLDMGDVVVTRRFTPSGSTLTLTNADGAKFPSPQKMLDSLLGALTFDPLEFTRMRPRDQFDQLKAVARVDLDLDQLEGLNRRDYERRTDLNREAKHLRAQLEGLRIPSEVPEAVDVASLSEQIRGLIARQEEAIKVSRARQAKEDAIQTRRDRVEELRRQAMALQEEIKGLKAELDTLPEAESIEDLTQQMQPLKEAIQQAETQNQAAQQARQAIARKEDLETRAAGLEAQAQKLTESMEARQRAKEEALASAAFPVPGLSLGDGQVLFNGVPLAQASSAEQLRVSTALAMAANPKVKVILIREGSLLDEDGMRLVAELAAGQGYQIWCEKVDSSRAVGVVIEDGSVIADNQEPQEMGVSA